MSKLEKAEKKSNMFLLSQMLNVALELWKKYKIEHLLCVLTVNESAGNKVHVKQTLTLHWILISHKNRSFDLTIIYIYLGHGISRFL